MIWSSRSSFQQLVAVFHALNLVCCVASLDPFYEVKKSCLSADGLPDPSLLDALHYAPLLNEYYATGDFVAKAFAVGKTVKRQN